MREVDLPRDGVLDGMVFCGISIASEFILAK